MKQWILQGFLSGMLLLPLSMSLMANTIFEEIICRINNDIITSSEYENAKNIIRKSLQAEGKLSQERLAEALDKRKNKLLKDMIEERLLVQRAVALNLTADTDVIKFMDRLRKENNLPSIEAVEIAMREQGINPTEFKRRVEEQSLREKVLGREVYYRLQISSEEVKKYYDSHQKDFDRPEQVRLQEILILTGEKKPVEVQKLEKKAEEALEKARTGEKFAEIVSEYSDGPTAKQGGGLGFFPRGQLHKEIETVVFSLRRGQISDILRSKDGFRIIKVIEKHSAGVQSLEAVKGEIGNLLMVDKAVPALKRYIVNLRKKSYIKVKPGYVDSGADVGTASSDDKAPELPKPMAFESHVKKK